MIECPVISFLISYWRLLVATGHQYLDYSGFPAAWARVVPYLRIDLLQSRGSRRSVLGRDHQQLYHPWIDHSYHHFCRQDRTSRGLPHRNESHVDCLSVSRSFGSRRQGQGRQRLIGTLLMHLE
jgi:hypothetical protein